MFLRAIPGVIGVFFFLQGMRWIVDPASAASALGMPLLDGLGRSTQVGDMTSFFLTLGLMALLGALRSNGTWLRGSALLLAGAATMRTLAWGIHEADFATEFIAIESIVAAILFFIANRFDRKDEAGRTSLA